MLCGTSDDHLDGGAACEAICDSPAAGGRDDRGATRDELAKVTPAGRSTLGRPGMRGGLKRRGR